MSTHTTRHQYFFLIGAVGDSAENTNNEFLFNFFFNDRAVSHMHVSQVSVCL